ncbi:hypothetical protein D9615_005791 [Tricholomella constricta]|uniref:FAD-binding domain-containing protein n=1 Tax=Tricholomella constricta TaxID=117010 RepID=A0A8H5HAP0_9AGAR|nr:hypothetical protein D9615_005791 [Tricholomella constricta]
MVDVMAFRKFKPGNATHLSVDFVIIGGGIAGLACAVALRRVNHRVTVLEEDDVYTLEHGRSGPCRMPPNLSKILYHWGLEDEVRAIAIKSESISLLLYETGELLGKHHWDDEVMKETRGEFVFTRHSALRRLLYDVAISCGAEVRLNTKVAAIDPEERTVTLEGSGEQLRADVVVGADGLGGLTRRILHHASEEPHMGAMDMFRHDNELGYLPIASTTVARELITADPDLAYLYDQEHTTMFNWFGHGHSVLGFPIIDGSEFGLFIYGPSNSRGGSWNTIASNTDLEAVLGTAEPKQPSEIGKVSSEADMSYSALDDWVHKSGRMVVVGEAAHPLPPGSVQATALTVEDAAVLAKLFSHLRTEDQIGSFLWAFQDLRQPRCNAVMAKEAGIMYYMTMPPGEQQQLRDETMRAKRDAGIGILQASDEAEESPEWAEIKEVFGYDAEDEADNWWVEWGLLRERSKGVDVSYGVPSPIQVERAISS